MFKYVVRYGKTGDAIYISHLDFLRALQRAMRRAELPLKYSEGFNPHPCLSFAQPLGVGIAGSNELFEVELTVPCNDLATRLEAAMPPGVHISEAVLTERNRFAAIARAVYGIALAQLPTEAQLTAFLALPEIRIEKRTKRGTKDTDIRPDIKNVWVQDGFLFADLAAGSTANLKPSALLAAMEQYIPAYRAGFFECTRLKMTDADGALV